MTIHYLLSIVILQSFRLMFEIVDGGHYVDRLRIHLTLDVSHVVCHLVGHTLQLLLNSNHFIQLAADLINSETWMSINKYM